MKLYLDFGKGVRSPGAIHFVATVASGGLAAQVQYQLAPGPEGIDVGAVVSDGLLRAEITLHGRSFPFEISGVSDEDTATVTLDRASRFAFRVRHQGSYKGPCVAKCWDGVENSPCVTCRLDDYTYRICC